MGSSCHPLSNTWKLAIILFITFSYFLAELIVGSWIASLSLIADSFHMLSDVSSIIIGMIAIRVAKMPKSEANTFGWQRAEVFGSLINCVTLITLCFTIFISAVQRMIIIEPVTKPIVMLSVGAGGLLINLIGLIIINPLGGSHGHSHALPATKVKDQEATESKNGKRNSAEDNVDSETSESLAVHIFASMKMNSLPVFPSKTDSSMETKEGLNMNMKAVALHIAGDFIGSAVVCISALILAFAPGENGTKEGTYKLYVDPVMSMLMVIIIVGPSLSLLRQASLILLQSVPEEVNVKKLQDDLSQIANVINVHDLHVWRLRPNVIIGTSHVKVNTVDEYNIVSLEMKNVFHEHDIHCTTIQPEFPRAGIRYRLGTVDTNDRCDLVCNLRENCKPNICCSEATS